MINQIAIQPQNPQIIYAAGRPEGFLKSIDRGKSWFPARKGLKNTSGYHLVINPARPNILYLGTFGGGIYKSENGGDSWSEINDGLGNTNIHALAINPVETEQLIAGTSTGELFISQNGGNNWFPFSEGLPFLEGEIIATLLFDSNYPFRAFLGQEILYTRNTALLEGGWKPLGESLKKERITLLTVDPFSKTLYAGTKNNGIFFLENGGKTWKPFSDYFKNQWIQKILFDPSRPSRLYVSVLLRGLFKSEDLGKTWEKLDHGLPSQDDILSLAVDPEKPNRLYAGTHNKGLFLSEDSGLHWTSPEVKQEPVLSIILSLFPNEPEAKQKQPSEPSAYSPPPPAFDKCTKCHGWTDPLLSQKKTYWRVPPNRRNWRTTVQRMGTGIGLTEKEKEEIITFLNNYHPGPSQ